MQSTISHLSHPKYRPDIDGLRAIAVLFVVAFHAYPHWIEGANLVRGGFIGVDIFFVISGFLISTIIFENLERGTFSFRLFYSRRIKRIFPALLLVLIASGLFGWYVLLPDEFIQLVKHIAAGGGFFSNIVLWNESGYFDNASDTKPLLHLWSLGIEEQFYIIWPVLVWFAWKYKASILIMTTSVLAASFTWNVYNVEVDAVATFYSPATRFWELLAGSLLSWFVMHKKETLKRLTKTQGNLISISGSAFLVFSLMTVTKESPFPGWCAVLPVLGTALVILGGAQAWINRVALSNRGAVWFGQISYPLYLWHWPLLVWFRISTDSPTSSLLERTILVAIAILLAWITHVYLEQKLRRSDDTWCLTLCISMALVITISLSGFWGIIKLRHGDQSLSRILQSKIDWYYPGNNFLQRYERGLRYYVSNGELEKTVYFGDSNMEQYSARINFLLSRNNTNLNTAIFVGNQRRCNLLRIVLADHNTDINCEEPLRRLRELLEDKRVSTFVIAANWAGYAKLLSDEESVINSLKRLAPHKQLYIVLTMPSGDELSPDNRFAGSRLTKLAPKTGGDSTFSLETFISSYELAHMHLKSISKKLGAIDIDPIDTLCPEAKCPVLDSFGTPLYKDSSHMTSSYARSSATFMDVTLKPVFTPP